jgi:hypothetical protein
MSHQYRVISEEMLAEYLDQVLQRWLDNMWLDAMFFRANDT